MSWSEYCDNYNDKIRENEHLVGKTESTIVCVARKELNEILKQRRTLNMEISEKQKLLSKLDAKYDVLYNTIELFT